MRFLKLIVPMLLVLALTVAPSFAATSLTATYLSSAINDTQTTVVVNSATGMSAGWLVFVDREAMLIRSISSTTLTVQRGVQGTAPAAHASSAGVLAQTPSAFYVKDVSGTCNTTTVEYLPWVNLSNGSVYDCLATSASSTTGAGVWVRYRQFGFSIPSFYGVGVVNTYTGDAAIPLRPGVTILAGSSAKNYTLAAPTYAQNGMVMVFAAGSAQAHTLTVSGGINGGSTATDVATFAALGDSLVLVANNGVWYLISFRGTSIA